tara:strand:- start:181 stop:330 length:150 start_codon:yes stop_codon:yes gene_type:complete
MMEKHTLRAVKLTHTLAAIVDIDLKLELARKVIDELEDEKTELLNNLDV